MPRSRSGGPCATSASGAGNRRTCDSPWTPTNRSSCRCSWRSSPGPPERRNSARRLAGSTEAWQPHHVLEAADEAGATGPHNLPDRDRDRPDVGIAAELIVCDRQRLLIAPEHDIVSAQDARQSHAVDPDTRLHATPCAWDVLVADRRIVKITLASAANGAGDRQRGTGGRIVFGRMVRLDDLDRVVEGRNDPRQVEEQCTAQT